MHTLSSLNYVHVLVTAVAGFLVGWLWYSALFGKTWAAEMKITDEMMNACKGRMPVMMFKGFFYTFVSTIGIAMVLAFHPAASWDKGAEVGAAVGLLLVGGRFLNMGVWTLKSCKVQCIDVAHEVVLFAVQGAILTAWA